MPDIVRFSVSLEEDLLEEFERYCSEQKFATRSEAVRQLIREKLTAEAWQSETTEAAGTLTIVYDHHRPQLRGGNGNRILRFQRIGRRINTDRQFVMDELPACECGKNNHKQ